MTGMSTDVLMGRRRSVKGLEQPRCYVGDVIESHGGLATNQRIRVFERLGQSRQRRAVISAAVIVRRLALSAAQRMHYFDPVALLRVGKVDGDSRIGRT